MVIGFSGTRENLTKKQHETLAKVLCSLPATEAHHGDCVGADAEFDGLCRRLGMTIHLHPPDDPRQRAWCAGEPPHHCYPVLPFLQRNRAIVAACDLLLATPAGMHEVRRSGTWATIRQARKGGQSLIIIFPDGTISRE